MGWTRKRIVEALKRLDRSGGELAYTRLARTHQSLVSAAAYHFGSYRRAVEQAGIDYSKHLQRPRWTKRRIIELIKNARRKGDDLHWSAVTRRGDELARAAFASLQPRLFGRWDRALHGAGLDADEVSRYRTWDRNIIVSELRARHRDGDLLSSGGVQHDDPALHAAATRHFGTWEAALRAARINPNAHRQRQRWTRQRIIAELRKLQRLGIHMSDSSVRSHSPGLHGAALREFKSFPKARRAARISLPARRSA